VEEQKLTAADALDGWFGWSVAISGDRIVVGVRYDKALGFDVGSAYVFRWNSSQWVEEARLVPADVSSGKEFGSSVAIDGNRVVVGTADDALAPDLGAAYVFDWNGSQWVENVKLTPSDGTAGGRFGGKVAIDGDRLGASAKDAVYVFDWDGSQWVENAKLTSSDGVAGDRFGIGLSLDRDRIAVGADCDDDRGTDSGSAYLFQCKVSVNPVPVGREWCGRTSPSSLRSGTSPRDFCPAARFPRRVLGGERRA
jgi:hypothetical protein